MKIHSPHITPKILPYPPGSKKHACPSNPLNLPTSIDFYSENKKIDYIYTASGQKTEQKTIDDGRVENRRQYAGSFVFKNRRLSYAASIAGRFLYVDDGRGSARFENEIALKDHLGNTRVTLDEHGNSTQQIDYYPFGHMIYASDTQTPFAEDNRYLYNGKELQDDFDLNWYDYGARFYDGQIGRWHVLDHAAEYNVRLSPYNYSFNNPIRYIDPDGNLPDDVTNTARDYTGTWYEWGGKKPYYIGGTGVSHEQALGVSILLKSQYNNNISMFHESKPMIYDFYHVDVPKGYNMGIDCSGLARIAFNANPDKLMGDLPHGTFNQIYAFINAERDGTGLLHTNFSEIQEGDLVFNTSKKRNEQGELYDHPSHVMIATGKVDKDRDGNVTSFEVIHANDHGKRVRTDWKNVEDHHRIGHTFRGGPAIANTTGSRSDNQGSGMSWNDFYSWVSRNNLWDKFK